MFWAQHILVAGGLLASRGEWMFLLGVSLMAAVFLRRSFKYHRQRRAESDGSAPDRTPSARRRRTASGKGQRPGTGLEETPKEVLQWQVEMHELARELKAELDTKIVLCQTLVRRAQAESERLEALLRRAGEESPSHPVARQPEPFSREPTTEPASHPDSDPRLAAETLLKGRQALEWLQRSIDPVTDPLNHQVYHLADLGQPVDEIARQTGRPAGDVEWILSLRARSTS